MTRNLVKRLFAFLVFVLFFDECFGAKANLNQRILDSQGSLEAAKVIEGGINDKLRSLADEILKAQEAAKVTKSQINELTKTVADLDAQFKSMNDEVAGLEAQNRDLAEKQEQTKQTLVRIIGQEFAFDLVVKPDGSEGVMSEVILENLHGVIKNELNSLVSDFEKGNAEIKKRNAKIRNVNEKMAELKETQKRLESLREQQNRDLALLQKHKGIYSKELLAVQVRQNQLAKALEELSILRKNEEERKRAAEMAKKREEEVKRAETSGEIRKIGSSYQKTKVRKYTGAKTISPLVSYTLRQKFGDFVDPVYKIPVFNESVILRSRTSDAKVRSVLDGKVVFAKDMGILGKVVIVEHANDIHTIYAHLDQIAPAAQVGESVQKGVVIGRVKQDLTFEVTQKNVHIDPMELIR